MANVLYSYGKLVDSLTLIVSDNDPVIAKVNFDGEEETLKILFKNEPNTESPETTLTWRTENNITNFIFYQWNNALGLTTQKTNTFIGTSSLGKPIYMTLMHHRVGETNKLTMQFIVGHSEFGEIK